MLTDPKANQIRGVAKLLKKDARTESGLFLLEGPQGLKELVARPDLVQEVFVTPDCLARYETEFSELAAGGVVTTQVSERVLDALSDTKTPQGVVAVCRQLNRTLDEVLAGKPRLIALLSQVRDPGNAGTVLRAADAAGADAVIFTDSSVDVYNPKVVRSTAGSLFHVPFVTGVDPIQTIAVARAAGMQAFAADGGGQAIPDLGQGTLASPTIWVFGNEAWGFEPEILAAVDRVVSVPIYGKAESLNLATAASVCLFASAMAQRG